MRRLFLVVLFSTVFFNAIAGVQHKLSYRFGPTVVCDDLWQIATQLTHQGDATPQQMMIAILRYNLKAFYHNNVNGLMRGYWLKIPPLSYVKTINYHDAIKMITRQNAKWSSIWRNGIKTSGKKKLYNKNCDLHQATIVKRIDSINIFHARQKSNIIVAKKNNINKTDNLDIKNIKVKKLAIKENVVVKKESNEIVPSITIEYIYPPFSMILQQLSNKSHVDLLRSNAEILQIYPEFDFLLDPIFVLSVVLLIVLLILLLLLTDIWLIMFHKNNQIIDVSNQKSNLLEEDKINKVGKNYQNIAGEDVVKTKLDLVRAYIAMGDDKKAKSVLNSVINEGNKSQQAKARELLKKIK